MNTLHRSSRHMEHIMPMREILLFLTYFLEIGWSQVILFSWNWEKLLFRISEVKEDDWSGLYSQYWWTFWPLFRFQHPLLFWNHLLVFNQVHQKILKLNCTCNSNLSEKYIVSLKFEKPLLTNLSSCDDISLNFNLYSGKYFLKPEFGSTHL